MARHQTTMDASAVNFFGNTGVHPSRSIAASSFLAGDESIQIVPAFNLPEMGLISGAIGPFHAGITATVPLWLATMLRRRKLAKIVPPPWLDADVLREVLRFERDPREASFSPELPLRHAEIARAVMSACRAGAGSGTSAGGTDAEVPNADTVGILLRDIQDARMDKIRKNVHTLSSGVLRERTKEEIIIDITNIGSLEMQQIRPFLTEALRLNRELSGKGESYSKHPPPDQGGGSTGGGASTTRRSRPSRLSRGGTAARNEESQATTTTAVTAEAELEEPRPLEDDELEEPRPLRDDELLEPRPMEEDEEEERPSRLRRHR